MRRNKKDSKQIKSPEYSSGHEALAKFDQYLKDKEKRQMRNDFIEFGLVVLLLILEIIFFFF